MSQQFEDPGPNAPARLHRGELPFWPVLALALLVMYFGVARSRPSADERGPHGEAAIGSTDTPWLEPRTAPSGEELDDFEPLAHFDERTATAVPGESGRRAAGEFAAEVASNRAQSSWHQHPWPPRFPVETGDAAGDDLERGSSERGDYRSGLRHGDWEGRWADGTLRSRGRFEDGKRVGLWQEYALGGVLLEETVYVGGVRHGDWRAFGENGVLVGEGEYENSVRNGEWVLFYGDGRVRERGEYRDGLREGPWEFYDDLGRPTPRAGLYVAGIKVD